MVGSCGIDPAVRLLEPLVSNGPYHTDLGFGCGAFAAGLPINLLEVDPTSHERREASVDGAGAQEAR